jgi:hypothetical protein
MKYKVILFLIMQIVFLNCKGGTTEIQKPYHKHNRFNVMIFLYPKREQNENSIFLQIYNLLLSYAYCQYACFLIL